MAFIVTRKKGGGAYHYLIHNSGKRQHERYLGKEIPKDIESVKRSFEGEIFRQENIPLLETIKRNYCKKTESVDPKTLDSQHHGFKITHIYSTQKIEGSTMTLGQTRKLLEHGLSPKDTRIPDIVEAQQIEKIFDCMLKTNDDISRRLILKWHEGLFERTDTNNAGRFRRQDVAPSLGKTEYALWPDVIPHIEETIRWYNKNKTGTNPVEMAALFHRRFELVHPFIDGNGRIGRLLMLLILHKNGYPMINIMPKEKGTYISKLESSYLKDDELIFLKWFVSKYIRDNRKYL